jgi:sulfur relay (sulfurtransferase) complex TusBCD TusD component (DsrE family)
MFRKMLLTLAVLMTLVSLPATAETPAALPGSLFVNLTTDEGHRANMALKFSTDVLDRGHPVAIWLNDRGVFLATKAHAEKFAAQQKTLAALMQRGTPVIVCPFCMKHYGVAETDLIDGAKVGNPDLTGGYLFKPGATTLSW